MSESSDLQREERRIRQFKGALIAQASYVQTTCPDRVAVEKTLKSLANDVIAIGFYGDKVNYAGIELAEICKGYSDRLKALGSEYKSYPHLTIYSKGLTIADELHQMVINLPF
ncbi:uncharacterized protein N7529_004800 [Penicillium soppii]|jgi:hypothetical protein|uniref:uncharacterized protein n=1 Tax=Penicillium soppii TaxID=69789 RepID=UPI0025469205|nr:uncharacterized protein N7529_004800 [Penicillium soppii]KAJ5872447.1 hypothetical protein N7529_004800 [Penicillium soppii]